MMDKLISQQAAIDEVEFGITYALALNTETGEAKNPFKQGNEALRKAVERIKQLPPAEPDIIRCKDCKHYSKHREDYMCGLNVLAYVRENDFCSRAERRTDE